LSGSGCGSADAFEVGAMKVLLAEGAPHLGGKPIDPAIYSGSAFGAFNAAVMASQAGGDTVSTLRYLERVWLEDLSSTPGGCGNGVYRLRGNPLTFLNPRCYLPQPLRPFLQAFADGLFLTANLSERFRDFLGGGEGSLCDRLLSIPDITVFFDMEPLKSNLRKHVDLERLRRSAKELVVIATDWQQGKPLAFLKGEMTGERGHDRRSREGAARRRPSLSTPTGRVLPLSTFSRSSTLSGGSPRHISPRAGTASSNTTARPRGASWPTGRCSRSEVLCGAVERPSRASSKQAALI
jgi:hypothetical protein